MESRITIHTQDQRHWGSRPLKIYQERETGTWGVVIRINFGNNRPAAEQALAQLGNKSYRFESII